MVFIIVVLTSRCCFKVSWFFYVFYMTCWWILGPHVPADLNFRAVGDRRLAMEVWNTILVSHPGILTLGCAKMLFSLRIRAVVSH
jgi:hypothetical protein